MQSTLLFGSGLSGLGVVFKDKLFVLKARIPSGVSQATTR